MASLRITRVDSNGQADTVPLPSDVSLTIGRADDNRLVLPGKKVSRRHGVIEGRGGVYSFADKGSTFGSFLNGRKVEGSVSLSDGDELDIAGNRIELVLNGASKASASRPPPLPDSDEDDIPSLEAALPDDEFAQMAVYYEEDMMRLKKRIHEQVLTKLNLPEIAGKQIQDEELRAKLEVALDQVLREVRHEIPREAELSVFRQAMLDELIGYGPITPMLRSASVNEVMVNGPDHIFVEKSGKLYETSAKFFDERHLISIIQRIVEPLGRHVDEASPMVDARLPDGSRVNAIIPPLALDGASVTIRKFATKKLGTDDLIAFGSMTADMAVFLEEAVRARQNILVSGGTGSGKTTLLNVLSQFIPKGERVVTIEDSAELRLTHKNLVRLEGRPPNIEGKGRVTIRDLVINALRMRPDRIIVGECRGAEALDMLQAMNTGHDGSLTTIHANNPRDSLARLENMVMMAGFELPSSAIRDQISSAIDIIVQQTRLVDGSRKIVKVSEVTGTEGDVILLQDIFEYEQEGFTEDLKVTGHYAATGNIPRFVEMLKEKGDLRLGMDVFVPKA
jgi:pilus assembly protein CpaF